MKSFNQLTLQGRIRRLRQMAWKALAQYDLEVEKMFVLSTGFNTIFGLNLANKKRAVLRINYPNQRSYIDIRSEMEWLAALAKETDIAVPAPFASRNGELVVTVETSGVPEPRQCAIFTWLNGRHLNQNPSLKTIQKMGAVMARLHNHAETFQPSHPFSTIKYDKAWHFGDAAPIFATEADPVFTPKRRAILQAAAKRVQLFLDQLYQDESGLLFLHADLHFWNVKLNKGEIQVLDFDDTMYCYPVQDIGISLFYIERQQQGVREAFKSGYAQFRLWPVHSDSEIDTIIAQRTLDLLSFLIVEADNPEFAGAIDRFLNGRLPFLEQWLQS